MSTSCLIELLQSAVLRDEVLVLVYGNGTNETIRMQVQGTLEVDLIGKYYSNESRLRFEVVPKVEYFDVW